MTVKAIDSIRRACSTGRDAQTVVVRRGHLRRLLAEYDRAVGVTVPAHIRAERGCVGCAHAGGGSDCDACDYPEWPHWEPRADSYSAAAAAPTIAVPCAQTPRTVVYALTAWRDSSPLQNMRRVGPAASTIAGVDWIVASVGGELVALQSSEPCAGVDAGVAVSLTAWLGPVPERASDLDLAALREWVGDAPPDADSSVSTGWIDSRPLDRRMVQHALSLAPAAGRVRVWWEAGSGPLLIAGDGWRVGVMPLRIGGRGAGAPRLRVVGA